MSKIGINGFDRAGRNILRCAITKGAQVVAINDPTMSLDHIIYAFKYDFMHGKFRGSVKSGSDGALYVNGAKIYVTNHANEGLDWSSVGVEYVVETQIGADAELAVKHLSEGKAKKVVICSPGRTEDIPTFVFGVNHLTYCPHQDIVINAQGELQCLALMTQILDSHFGVHKALATAISSSPDFDNFVDEGNQPHNPREGRASRVNVIPSPGTFVSLIGRVIPQLNGCVSGIGFRVPAQCVSAIDLTVKLKRETNLKDIRRVFQDIAGGTLLGIVADASDPVISSNFLDDEHSAIFDSFSGIELNPTCFKLIAWYDSEISTAMRVVDLIKYMQFVDKKNCKS